MKLSIVGPDTVDYDEVVHLQRTAFESVAGKTQLDAVQTADYYHWKYHAAAGAARIAQIRNPDGELISMNSIFPLFLRLGAQITTGWQSCDTATHPSAQGKGCFKKCITALKETIADGEIFFGYPNVNSMPGFTKFGWRKLDALSAFFGIVPGFAKHDNIRKIERFDDSTNALAERLVTPDSVVIDRSSSYLNWRYCDPARPLYTVFVADDASGSSGYVSVRLLKMNGLRICLVMDCAAVSSTTERSLIARAARWAMTQGCFFVLAITNVWKGIGPARQGLFPIPQKLSPRPLVLMAEAIGTQTHCFLEATWKAHIGDWDGL